MAERLQKLIAQAGIASRRAAEELITEGEVTVNGVVVTELGTKADPATDHIKVRGKLINEILARRSDVYILLNKPKGYLSSAADPEGRKLVTDLVKGHGRLHPVGRLDYNTEGLIILTNDGEFTNRVAASKTIPKVYEVKVKGMPTNVAINKLRRGVLLEDGYKTAPAEIKELQHTDKNGWYEVTLHEGHNQQIRKMFDTIGHSVVKLKRIAIGSISDPYLRTGESRPLTHEEVAGIGNAAPVKRRASATKPPRSAKPSDYQSGRGPKKPARGMHPSDRPLDGKRPVRSVERSARDPERPPKYSDRTARPPDRNIKPHSRPRFDLDPRIREERAKRDDDKSKRTLERETRSDSRDPRSRQREPRRDDRPRNARPEDRGPDKRQRSAKPAARHTGSTGRSSKLGRGARPSGKGPGRP